MDHVSRHEREGEDELIRPVAMSPLPGMSKLPIPLITSEPPSLRPHPGAPLSAQPELLPDSVRAKTTAHNRLSRAPPSQLMDAPARAALNMPNGTTSASQARAIRSAGNLGGDARTPDFEIKEGEVFSNGNGHASYQDTPDAAENEPLLLAPTPIHRGNATSSSAPPSRTPSPSFLRRIFIDRASSPSQHLTRPTFPPPSLSTYSPHPPKPLTFIDKIRLILLQTTSLILSTTFLTFVVAWAVSAELSKTLPAWMWRTFGWGKKRKVFPWDDEKYWKGEGKRISKEPKDYARQVGMDIENQVVETEDGYLLRMHRVIDPQATPRSDGRGGFPVLVLHGLFQSSGSFVTSEDRSLAFWLAKQGGYQVYLGNTRGVFNMGHRNFSRNDPRFWDWTIRELAMYDLPALVDHVCKETGYDKIGFIGHSQGNGLAFISLSVGMCPELGRKLSCFIALAPAVYAGPLTHGFPFTVLNKMEWTRWKRFFGVLDFIPIMRWAYDYAPAKVFAALGYTMFAFLFSWTDTNWLHRRKTKMFRFTPTPVSSASIFWWCGKGGFADRKCTLDDTLDRWFDARFPPLSIYYGGRDFLVLTEPLLDRIKEKEKHVELIKVTKLELSEHCDFYWAAEAVEWAYESFVDDIERTRPRYPEEIANGEGRRSRGDAQADGHTHVQTKHGSETLI